MWAYTAVVDPKAALAGAVYLGFPHNHPLDRLITVSKSRRHDRRTSDAPRRSLLQCLVFASKGVDVTCVLEGLITQARPTHAAVTSPVFTAVAAVQLPLTSSSPGEVNYASQGNNGGSCAGSPLVPSSTGNGTTLSSSSAPAPPAAASSYTMILRSVTEEQTRVLLESPGRADELQRCDVATFVFDSCRPDSFKSAVELMVAVSSASGNQVPCIFVALNGGSEMPPGFLEEVEATCSALEVGLPLQFPQASHGVGLAGVYRAVALAALNPDKHIPQTPSLRATKQYRRMLRRAALVTAGGTVAALAGYFAYRMYKQNKTHESGATEHGT